LEPKEETKFQSQALYWVFWGELHDMRAYIKENTNVMAIVGIMVYWAVKLQ
jgi:hypothetical protein